MLEMENKISVLDDADMLEIHRGDGCTTSQITL
jgi:hypothetical protein